MRISWGRTSQAEGHSKCKGLLMGMCLAHLRHNKEAYVAQAEWMIRTVGGDVFRKEMGLHLSCIAANRLPQTVKL